MAWIERLIEQIVAGFTGPMRAQDGAADEAAWDAGDIEMQIHWYRCR